MASADEYAQWIVDNADKKGTPEFNTVAAAYADAKGNLEIPQESQPQEQTGLVGWNHRMGETIRDVGVNALTRAADLMSPVVNYMGLNTSKTPEQQKADIADFASQNSDPTSNASGVGRFATDVGITAGVGGVLGKGVLKAAELAPKAIPYATKLATALESGGMSTGAPADTIAGKAVNAATQVAGGAITGAASGGVVNPDEMLKSGVVGAMLPGAGGALGIGRRFVSPVILPMDSAVRNIELAAGGKDKLAQALLKSQAENEVLPLGQKMTLGQTSGNAGIAALERASKLKDAGGFQDIYQNQTNAMHDAMDSLAGTQDLQDKIIANRSAMVSPYYDANAKEILSGDKLDGLMQRADAMGAVAAAKKNALGSGRGFGIDMAGDGTKSYTGADVQGVQQELQSLRSQAQRSGDTSAAHVLGNLLSDFKGYTETATPNLTEANRLYSELSPDVNQLQLAQALKNKLFSGTDRATNATVPMRSAMFANALADSQNLIRKETGQNQTLAQLYENAPEKLQQLSDIQRLIGRNAELNTLGTGINSTTAQLGHYGELAKSMGGIIGKTGDVINHFSGTEKAVNTLLQNPKMLAKALKDAEKRGLMVNPTNAATRAAAYTAGD